ncbi:sulfatase family protein [Thalassotalea sp. PLHSN55]|uniref:sulfatase family protein n=1 Tax=Thalassotalea sp. PLHSN55 TaxID=3435888 RepID=UPI003F82B519
MKFITTVLFTALLTTQVVSNVASANKNNRPNVLIIVADDQGWGDVGFNGITDIPTPNLDSLAASGVSFEQGYASHPYCSPSRAGLLTGRYQQRFGHENNIPHKGNTENFGLPLTEELLSQTLKKAGYHTAAIGKWHLGDSPHFWPNQRGFDEWFGFYGGGLSYWGETGKKPKMAGVLRNGKKVPKGELSYLTDDFSNAAVHYIEMFSRSQDPFFMYLAYNAPHAPMHTRQQYVDKVSHIEEGKRAVYASMNVAMDEGIGRVIDKLKQTGEYDNTLIIYYSDNGGKLMFGASNAPYRGEKGMLFEGGIRVPFVMSWPAVLPASKRYTHAITALDIFPTVIAASKVTPPKKALDGLNLLPYLTTDNMSMPAHKQPLFWRYSEGKGYAVRAEHYKLIYSAYKQKNLLFDLSNDPYERLDLALLQPKKVQELTAMYQQWHKHMAAARWPDTHLENITKDEQARTKTIKQATAGEAKLK